jgi:two-component system cell cycle response regulator
MKVLVADDEVVSRRLIESSVRRWGYEAVVARDGLEALEILHSADPPKLAVLDWLMPGLDGVQLCRQLRQEKEDSYTYIIILTAKHTQSDVVQGLAAGADDYIAKPFDPQELRVRLHTGKRILCLLDQLTTAREALRELAAHDPLTALWNHKAITELVVNELARADRQGSSVGVVLVDLDHFKSINDTHGHLVGDQVLREAANCMNRVVRPYDAVGRLGGEEFLIVLPGCDRINAVSHAERLRSALREIVVNTLSVPIHFTASLGVTVVGPEMRVDAETAIRTADSAMYAAKGDGRDRVEFRNGCLELV